MPSAYDLSLTPDSRFGIFRQDYTLRQHAVSLAEQLGGGMSAVTGGLERIADAQADAMWAIEACLDALIDEVVGLRGDVRQGFRRLETLFHWGIERLRWEHEQDRELYRETIDILRHPLGTQAAEHWEHALSDIENHRWKYAVDALCQTIEDNPRHYLAQFQLGHILFFQFGQSEPALHHFEQAALFADEIRADDRQKHWAALAYAHVSLLQRLVAKTTTVDRNGYLEKAVKAASRAVELEPTLPHAVHEQILGCLLLSREAEAHDAMVAAVALDENLLAGLETNDDMAPFPAVRQLASAWRDAVENLVRRLTVALDATRTLVSTHALPTDLSEAANVAGTEAVGARDSETPRRTVVSCLAALSHILKQAECHMSDIIKSARKSVDAHAKDSEAAARDCKTARGRLDVLRNTVVSPNWGSAFGQAFGMAVLVFLLVAALTSVMLRAPDWLEVEFPGKGRMQPASFDASNRGRGAPTTKVSGVVHYPWDCTTRPSPHEVAETITDFLVSGASGKACRTFRLSVPGDTRRVFMDRLAWEILHKAWWVWGPASGGFDPVENQRRSGTLVIDVHDASPDDLSALPDLYSAMQDSGARWEVVYRPLFTSQESRAKSIWRNAVFAFGLCLLIAPMVLAHRNKVRRDEAWVADTFAAEGKAALAEQKLTTAMMAASRTTASLGSIEREHAAFSSAIGTIRTTADAIAKDVERLPSQL